jgi:hypothetical protein
MTSPYKKRAKGSWSVGKDQKAASNAEERQYEKTEIEQAIKETDPKFRVKKGKRKKNKRASLEHRLEWYQQRLDEALRTKQDSSWVQMMRNGIKRTKERIEDLDE